MDNIGANKAPKAATYEITYGCMECGQCRFQCPGEAISHGTDQFVIDQSKCIHCGMCFAVCRFGAIVKK